MSENNPNKALAEENNKIQWLGLDGFLCLLYVVEAVFFTYAVVTNNDFVIGKLIPYGVALITTIIFAKYITQVVGFSKKNRKR